jgi:integrase
MNRCGFNSDPAVVDKHGEATVHSLRHTFASWLLQDGAGLSEVLDMLGHATHEMTRRYAHLEKAVLAVLRADRLNTLAQRLGHTLVPSRLLVRWSWPLTH